MRTVEQCFEMYERTGSLEDAAIAIGEPVRKMRQKMQAYLKRRGMDYEWLSPHAQVRVINKYTERSFDKFLEHLKMSCGKPVAVCRVGDKIRFVKPEQIEGDLIGVYDGNSKTDDRRDDLYWYVKNYMEAEQ